MIDSIIKNMIVRRDKTLKRILAVYIINARPLIAVSCQHIAQIKHIFHF
jgi:hypothetical protein